MRILFCFLILVLGISGCKKENPPIVQPVMAEAPSHRFWPLQNYTRWIFAITVWPSIEREVELGPKTAETPDYFPFVKAPFPAFEGLNVNDNGDLELVWKYLNGKTKGKLLAKELPEPNEKWYSTPSYFYLLDEVAGIPIYDSLRFEITYDGFYEIYNVLVIPKTFNSVAKLKIRTQLWHKYEKRWVTDYLPIHTIYLSRDLGPVIIANGEYSIYLLEAQ